MKRLAYIMTLVIIMVLAGCGTSQPETSKPHEETAVSISEKQEIQDIDEETDPTDESSSPQEEETEAGSTAILDSLKVHFIDVGQADATLFNYSDGEQQYNILFDTGDWRGNEVVPYLKNQGITDIDLIIVSHPDADHIGQLDKVMQNFSVGEVWMSGNESSSQTFQRAIEAVLTSDADYHEPRAGEEFQIGPLEIDILYPDNISGNSNEESIAAKFTYGNVRFVLTGDAGRKEETYMRNNFEVDADILHLGHHGSKTSTDPAFFDAVSPDIAVYSAGAGNSYGHPSPEVVSSIEQRNIELYGTDTHGHIVITTNGQEIGPVETKKVSQAGSQSNNEQTSQSENVGSSQTTIDESTSKPSSGCININEATVQELQEIIHIGPVRAEELVELRPFKSVDDLKRLNGIGPARIADIKSEGNACVG